MTSQAPILALGLSPIAGATQRRRWVAGGGRWVGDDDDEYEDEDDQDEYEHDDDD